MFFALLKTFLVLIIGIFSGYFFKKGTDRKNWISVEKRKEISIFLQKLAMIWLISITYIGSLWVYDIQTIGKIMSMPFVGAVSIITGGFFAVMIAKYYHYNRIDTGSLFSCGYFVNNVVLGGMICFFYLGEEGYALVPIFTLFMRFLYFGLGFPIAYQYSGHFVEGKDFIKRIIEIIKDPFFSVGMVSIVIGFLLNMSGLKRPEIYKTVNEILIPANTYILLFSIGLNLKFSRVFDYLKECLYISIIRFFMAPAIILMLVWLLGYQDINQGLPLKVSLILSTMPVAFNSIITANVYSLNIDLVNSCWIFTTFGLILVLPVILYVVSLF